MNKELIKEILTNLPEDVSLYDLLITILQEEATTNPDVIDVLIYVLLYMDMEWGECDPKKLVAHIKKLIKG